MQAPFWTGEAAIPFKGPSYPGYWLMTATALAGTVQQRSFTPAFSLRHVPFDLVLPRS